MSPEQARGQLTDARTDLFSLGTVLYQLACGALPFAGQTSAVVFDAILNRDPVPIAQVNPAVPIEFGRILEKALEKDRNLRYQSATDLKTDLIRLKRDLDSGRKRAPTAAPVDPARNPRSRRLPSSTSKISAVPRRTSTSATASPKTSSRSSRRSRGCMSSRGRRSGVSRQARDAGADRTAALGRLRTRGPLDALRKAHAAGFGDSDWARRDPDLAVLHGNPEFERLYPPTGSGA